jgi:hypothetical protein
MQLIRGLAAECGCGRFIPERRMTGRLYRRPVLHFFIARIAKPEAREQSFLQGLRPAAAETRSIS